MKSVLRQHAGEYAIEALGLGAFMVSACAFATLLEHPGSPVRPLLPDASVRRALMGLAMGLTAVAIIYSPWGRRSGAHINPCVTLTFLRLGRIRRLDALAYVVAQCAGAVLGVLACRALGLPLADPSVDWVVTRPGPAGETVAFVAEAAISFLLMLVVLTASSHAASERWTGMLAGACLALFITLEAPLSGTSMNPARTLGSALPAADFRGFWIYLAAPLSGMVAASELHVRLVAARDRGCAKLRHCERLPCLFCGYQPSPPRTDAP